MLFPIPTVSTEPLSAYCAPFGLSLSPSQVYLIQKRESQALEHNGRIAFSGSILPKLVYAFADSPYITQSDLVQTLCELTEVFYALKSETHERLSDDELIEHMARLFNGSAHGAVSLLPDLLFDPQEAADAP